MRNRSAALALVPVMILCSLCFTGCYHEETVDGLTFVPLCDYYTKNPGDFLYSSETDDSYVCRIEADAPEDIVIPDEFNDKPVCYVTMTHDKGTYPFKSITFGKNVRAISRLFSYEQTFPNLREIELPNSLEWIEDSFDGEMDHIEITIPESLKHIYGSFSNSENENIRIIIPDEAKAPLIAKMFDDLHGIEIGSQEVLAYNDQVDREALCRQAKSFFGAELDEAKKIEPAEATRYKSMLDGPIVVTQDCCEDQFDYSSETEPEYISVARMLRTYPEADLMKDHKQPAVYCVAERTQGKSHGYGSTEFAAYTFYEMRYRISLRKIADGELLAWYEVDTGYAPDSKEVSTSLTYDETMNKLGYQMGDNYYLRGMETESNLIPQPEDCVIPYVFS